MATIASFLMAITGSLAARVLTSLGIGFISYVGLSALASNLVTSVTSVYNSGAGDVIAVLNLAGVGQGLGIILGALITRASMSAIKKMVPLQ